MEDYIALKRKLIKCPYKYVKDAVEIMLWLGANHKGTSFTYLNKQWKLLNSCCKWGVAIKKIDSNPFAGLRQLVPKNKSKEEIHPFNQEEMKEIIQVFYEKEEHYAPLVEFLFLTGCRPNEALALQWKHIRGSKITFCQTLNRNKEIEIGTKTQTRRSITVNNRILAILNNIKPNSFSSEDFVFLTPTGKLIDWRNFTNQRWIPILKELVHIEYRNPYQMRHTAITLMVRAGIDSVMIARWVGNSPSIISSKYLGDVSDIVIPELS